MEDRRTIGQIGAVNKDSRSSAIPLMFLMRRVLEEAHNVNEATQIITRELPQSRVIGLSMHIDNDIAAAMQKAGAVGYLTKGCPSDDLVAAIRACGRQK